VAPDDAPAIFGSYGHDAEVTRYLTWRPHRDEEETRRVIAVRESWWREGPELSWVITLRPAGTVIGMISANRDATPASFSLGYVFARSAWGQGYATEAARAIVDALLALPAVTRIWAIVDCENLASQRVLEKAGLRREALLPRCSIHPAHGPEPRDCWCFAKVR
jgi:ribosomal-protein-alanine N-acetyltransferase